MGWEGEKVMGSGLRGSIGVIDLGFQAEGEYGCL